jgi:hypothetical protein
MVIQFARRAFLTILVIFGQLSQYRLVLSATMSFHQLEPGLDDCLRTKSPRVVVNRTVKTGGVVSRTRRGFSNPGFLRAVGMRAPLVAAWPTTLGLMA